MPRLAEASQGLIIADMDGDAGDLIRTMGTIESIDRPDGVKSDQR